MTTPPQLPEVQVGLRCPHSRARVDEAWTQPEPLWNGFRPCDVATLDIVKHPLREGIELRVKDHPFGVENVLAAEIIELDPGMADDCPSFLPP